MKYLLDTHAFIWLDVASAKLSPKVRSLIANQENILFLSLVSVWEIQIKHQLGKLQLRLPLEEIIEEQQQANQIEILPITLSHILELGNLPDHHRDPFDRLLIAQSKVENIPLISRDSEIAKYPIEVFW